MSQTVRIAAIGDILMWKSQIESARIPGENRYNFDFMFKEIAPYLSQADLTIGNLETTFSGREGEYQRRNPKTGYPMFNCPDELAITLKKVGFDVLTTANNHCMDRGIKGLNRTLDVLDRHGFDHTGTFRTSKETQELLIKEVNGIRIGVVAYTYGTNYIPVPKDRSWAVNRINEKKMILDIRKLRNKVDVIIVSLHFGKEFRFRPEPEQKELVMTLFRSGADIILGAHPHVLQPWEILKVKDVDGETKNRFVIYSLGNFISERMMNVFGSEVGVILYLDIKKDLDGTTAITHINLLPTWTQQIKGKTYNSFRVLPISKFLEQPDSLIGKKDQQNLKLALKHGQRILGSRFFNIEGI